ncbi:hypothetical protein TNCV_2386801 [Trichonephila clavipes]|nr:hypothetical protein TNCV_2386801 [Trichonephila clavipes]
MDSPDCFPSFGTFGAFMRSVGLIHKEFLPESTTLNAIAYAEVLKRLLQRILMNPLQQTLQNFGLSTQFALSTQAKLVDSSPR